MKNICECGLGDKENTLDKYKQYEAGKLHKKILECNMSGIQEKRKGKEMRHYQRKPHRIIKREDAETRQY